VKEAIVGILLVSGALFGFLAAVGMCRLPDTIIRMHATTKAGTLGCGFVLLAVGVHFYDTATSLRALAAFSFLMLTAPVAAHLMGRAAYRSGVRLWKGTWHDELDSGHEDDGRDKDPEG
jgi:multicomponent Na+:H+ antiporter subunit G